MQRDVICPDRDFSLFECSFIVILNVRASVFFMAYGSNLPEENQADSPEL